MPIYFWTCIDTLLKQFMSQKDGKTKLGSVPEFTSEWGIRVKILVNNSISKVDKTGMRIVEITVIMLQS